MHYSSCLKNILLFAAMLVVKKGLAQQELPADKMATKQTVNLYRNLKKISGNGFLFGHQDDLAYGVNWRYQPGRSDVKESCGDYPALFGWDLCGLENDSVNNIDGVPFSKMKNYIIDCYNKGAAITIDWHFISPLGQNKTAWDTTHGTVASILPGGPNNALFQSWLDKGAIFLKSLKGKNGEIIPIIFRPFHELTGNWFWWCQNTCTPQEFKELWKFTHDYLSKKGLHNLLYVYNAADKFSSKEEFLERYPGDDMVDILSFDMYQFDDPATSNKFVTTTNAMLAMVQAAAKEKNKLMALAETGYEQIPYNQWWTKTLLPAIGNHSISYVLVWRNHGFNKKMVPPHMHYYAPYKGHPSVPDFVKFYNDKKTLFQKDAIKLKLYQ